MTSTNNKRIYKKRDWKTYPYYTKRVIKARHDYKIWSLQRFMVLCDENSIYCPSRPKLKSIFDSLNEEEKENIGLCIKRKKSRKRKGLQNSYFFTKDFDEIKDCLPDFFDKYKLKAGRPVERC